MELEDSHQKAWSDLAASFLGIGQFDKARRAVARALELDPRDPISLCTLGNCQEHSGDLKAALASYEQAAALDPHYEPARNEVQRLRKRVGSDQRHRRPWPWG